MVLHLIFQLGQYCCEGVLYVLDDFCPLVDSKFVSVKTVKKLYSSLFTVDNFSN